VLAIPELDASNTSDASYVLSLCLFHFSVQIALGTVLCVILLLRSVFKVSRV